MSPARQGRRTSAGWRLTAGTRSSGDLSPSVMPGIMLDHRRRAQPAFAQVIGKGGVTGDADEFRPRQMSISESQVAYVRRDAYDRRGRVACAAVRAPPVYDAALEASGGVAATGEA